MVGRSYDSPVLRPLLACRWIERKRSQPPTLFHAIMDDELVSPEERIWIEGLLKHKAEAHEAEPVAVNDARVNCIRAELERYGSMLMSPAALSSGSKDELDGLVRRWVVTHDAPPCPQAARDCLAGWPTEPTRQLGCAKYKMQHAPHTADCGACDISEYRCASRESVRRPPLRRSPPQDAATRTLRNFHVVAWLPPARGTRHHWVLGCRSKNRHMVPAASNPPSKFSLGHSCPQLLRL